MSARHSLTRWLIVLMIVGWTCASPAVAQEKWALLVGVDRYQDSAISPLRCAAADTRILADALRDVGGFPVDHIIVLSNLEGVPPTSANVLRHIEGLQKVMKPGDTFVFFFSGHGVEKDGERFLLTSDTDTGSVTLLRRSALGMRDLQAALHELPCARILQIIDACANNPWSTSKALDEARMTDGMTRDLVLTSTRKSGDLDAAVTVFSCRVGQRSYEGYKSHGYFTWFLVEGLRGAAADTEGRVTVPSLASYLRKQVPEAVRIHENGREQVPDAITLGTAAMDWVLATTNRPASPPSPTGAGVFSGEPRYIGTWRYEGATGLVMERDVKSDATYLDYTVKNGSRTYNRNGIYDLFADGRFRYRVTDGDGSGKQPEGTYRWLDENRVILIFRDGTQMNWTRK